MFSLISGISVTPLKDVTPLEIGAAINAVSDSLRPESPLPALMFARWNLSKTNQFPHCLWLLNDHTGLAGWVGWAPYQEAPHTWQTTTYFAPRLRRRGLLPHARCIQVHAQDQVRTWCNANNQPSPTFVSSIAISNPRSLRASLFYARDNEWLNTWEILYEPIVARHAWVLTWPHTPPHACIAHPVKAFPPTT